MKTYKKRSLFLNILQSAFQMKGLKNSIYTIALITSLFSFSSLATEVNGVDTDKFLLNSCNAIKATNDNNKTLPCIMYIKGFFNGLINAGNSNVSKIKEKTKKTSTLVERAYASRVGKITSRKPLNLSCITIDEFKLLILGSLSNQSSRDYDSVEQINSFLLKMLTTACISGNKNN